MHIVAWNAEGLRTKVPELQSWLPTVKADVVAIQEAQFTAKSLTRIPGFQPPVVTRRGRGRAAGAAARGGGDVAIYVRGGLTFAPLPDRLVSPDDDTTEACGVRILGTTNLDIINIYRPPIRNTQEDEREERFDPGALPVNDATLLVGGVNTHHPFWNHACEVEDTVGRRLADWMDGVGWTPLNSGEPMHVSYWSGGSTAPDLVACSRGLAKRST